MDTIKAIKLSFIGGVSGGIEVLVGYWVSSQKLYVSSIYLDFIVGGLLFIIVGVGIMTSFIISIQEFSSQKNKILMIGAIAGFLSGLFYHFGIGLYIGIVIFPIIIGLGLRIIKLNKEILKISVGGIAGGLCGVVSMFFLLFLIPIFDGALFTILSVASVAYFMNFGMLYSYGKQERLTMRCR